MKLWHPRNCKRTCKESIPMSNETRRILLVEDEKAIRDAVTAYL